MEDIILQETGYGLLQENGDIILLEIQDNRLCFELERSDKLCFELCRRIGGNVR